MTLPEKRYARFGRVLTFDKRGTGDQDALVGEADVHTGEIEVVGEGVQGIAVHIGARGSALASANEVLVSSTVRDLVAGSGLLTDIAQRCTRPDHSGRGPNGPGFSSACI